MKQAISAITVSVLILGTAAFASAGGPFVDREWRQPARVHQSVQGGAITPGGYHALQREQGAIKRYRHTAWSDGRLTPYEAGRLHRMQDRANWHIYRAKHNARWRY